MAIDAERERISLGLKQLADDPIANYLNEHAKGSVVSGKVTEVDVKFATVELAESVLGTVRASEISVEKIDDARTKLAVGDVIEAKIMGADRKTHMITLSMKNKDTVVAAAAPKKSRAATTTTKKKDKADADTDNTSMKTTLGDLFKAKMDQDGDI